ncbi:MAG: DUF2188 domain-containing protein [Bacteroidetes bacterium]|nr:DUF2188 domain-containing protein [Bacteroidota bacterium]
MPYTKNDYPNTMKNLPEKVREKAIEILNTLLEDKKMEESIAIPTSISRAKDWATNRGIDIENTDTDSKSHGNDLYILPRKDEWIIKREKSEKASFTFSNKKDAIDKAFEMAEEDHVNVTIYGSDGKIQTKKSFV